MICEVRLGTATVDCGGDNIARGYNGEERIAGCFAFIDDTLYARFHFYSSSALTAYYGYKGRKVLLGADFKEKLVAGITSGVTAGTYSTIQPPAEEKWLVMVTINSGKTAIGDQYSYIHIYDGTNRYGSVMNLVGDWEGVRATILAFIDNSKYIQVMGTDLYNYAYLGVKIR